MVLPRKARGFTMYAQENVLLKNIVVLPRKTLIFYPPDENPLVLPLGKPALDL